ncbi:MAG: carbamoyltransferase HypF [Chitinivibrionales bacterium]|nr:carbamoyltransferase HypF [Chitinivibrionales bacterium]
MARKHIQITIQGTVQGVGFRPFVYRTALRFGVRGSVCNSVAGVVIDACGEPAVLEQFLHALRTELPPLAVIRSLETVEVSAPCDAAAFTIEASALGESPQVDVTRDTATCDACVRELRDPSDRRYRHPFINCTDCGPRYTIIQGLPYDRPRTTMRGFPMCPQCEAEYRNPADRRFHAQPVCCPACGPTLTLLDAQGEQIASHDPVADTIMRLARGEIVAIKGLGGFHLACRADNQDAVVRLRERKQREQKPLAIMVGDIDTAGRYCDISRDERGLLSGIERPIVLLSKRREGADAVAQAVAPTVTTLGVMLPYTPIHHLLFDTDAYDALVMTSGNRGGEPICIDNDEALEKLRGIADAYLMHDRAIHVRVDDSVARVLGGAPVLLRRARGYVPAPLAVDAAVDGIVALGGIMKSTVCVGRGRTCYVSQYLGTADNTETIENCVHVAHHLTEVLGVRPRLFVGDMHPGGFTEAIVRDSETPYETVQHHHAHAAACLGENRVDGPAICLVYDGLGLGEDDSVWGGEILLAGRGGYRRVGHLRPVFMPGGDAATRNPGRMAIGILWELLGREAVDVCPWMGQDERSAVRALLENDLNCPRTSSMGRLFDAAAAMLDVCRRQTYEGQPAIELEGVAERGVDDAYGFELLDEDGRILLDGAALLAAVRDDMRRGTPAPVVSARFHNTVADMSVEAACRAAAAAGVTLVALCGGCFQNAMLFERTVRGLRARGVTPVFHRILSPGWPGSLNPSSGLVEPLPSRNQGWACGQNT